MIHYKQNVFLFFGGALIFESLWGMIIFAAILEAVFISVLLSQDNRIHALEKRVEELEKGKVQEVEI